MLLKLYIFVYTVTVFLVDGKLRKEKIEQAMVHMDAQDLVNQIQNFMISKVFENLTEEFVTKASEQFAALLKTDQNIQVEPAPAKDIRIKEEAAAEVSRALHMIEDPNPDGDNLDRNSAQLTDDESKNTTQKVNAGPVRINGKLVT